MVDATKNPPEMGEQYHFVWKLLWVQTNADVKSVIECYICMYIYMYIFLKQLVPETRVVESNSWLLGLMWVGFASPTRGSSH